jgi:very-short-patch-repair endonuclease
LITLKILNSIKDGWFKEYKFCPERKWRFDYAHPFYKIAIEIEGGLWVKGRHNRPTGYIKDMEKYNAATLRGWRVFRYTPDQIKADMVNDITKFFEFGILV